MVEAAPEVKVKPVESSPYLLTEVTKKLDITGGTWDEPNGVYRLDKDEQGITTEFKLKKYITTKFYAVSEFKFKDLPDPKTGEVVKTRITWNKKTQEWQPKPALESARDAFVHYKTLPFKGSVSTELTNGVPKFTLHIEKTKWFER